MPVIAALLWPRLRVIDAASAAEPQLELLRAVPIFAPLPGATLESLASHLTHMALTQGEVLFRAGDRGDRFWIVAAGEVEVVVAGELPVRLGSGDHFGEIALLRDVPRTATGWALTEVELYSLERDEFVAAVTGHPASREVADAVIATRLASLRPRVFSV